MWEGWGEREKGYIHNWFIVFINWNKPSNDLARYCVEPASALSHQKNKKTGWFFTKWQTPSFEGDSWFIDHPTLSGCFGLQSCLQWLRRQWDTGMLGTVWTVCSCRGLWQAGGTWCNINSIYNTRETSWLQITENWTQIGLNKRKNRSTDSISCLASFLAIWSFKSDRLCRYYGRFCVVAKWTLKTWIYIFLDLIPSLLYRSYICL